MARILFVCALAGFATVIAANTPSASYENIIDIRLPIQKRIGAVEQLVSKNVVVPEKELLRLVKAFQDHHKLGAKANPDFLAQLTFLLFRSGSPKAIESVAKGLQFKKAQGLLTFGLMNGIDAYGDGKAMAPHLETLGKSLVPLMQDPNSQEYSLSLHLLERVTANVGDEKKAAFYKTVFNKVPAVSGGKAPKLKVTDTSLCKAMCKLVDKMKVWMNVPDKKSWGNVEFPTKALALLFVNKARVFCPNADQIVKNAKKKGGLYPQLVKQVQLANAKKGPVKDLFDYYGRPLFLQFAKDALARDPNGWPGLKVLVRETDAKLKKDLENTEGFLKNFNLSQSFNMYAFSAGLAAVKSPPASTWKRILKIYDAVKDPRRVPYIPATFRSVMESSWRTARGSAGRSPTFYLAAYLKSSGTPPKKEIAKRLKIAMKNFVDHSPSLILSTTRGLTHTPGDGMAPYFFYPNLPYVSFALSVLDKEGLGSDDLRKSLRQVVFGRFLASGLAPANSHRPSSASYRNPFLGLATLPLLTEVTKGCFPKKETQTAPQSNGIVFQIAQTNESKAVRRGQASMTTSEKTRVGITKEHTLYQNK